MTKRVFKRFLPILLLILFSSLCILLFPLDLLRRRKLQYRTPNQRVDERDTPFARMARVKGTKTYQAYYADKPLQQKKDDHIRRKPALFEPGSLYYDHKIMMEGERWFDRIDHIHPSMSNVKSWSKQLFSSADKTAAMKSLIIELGAVAVGITKLDPVFLYTHKGRFDNDYGTPVTLDHSNVIVFLVEMDYREMRRAPYAETLRESALQYYRAAYIAKHVEAVLRHMGYEAKAHYDAHYDLMLPPFAERAGLGEIGRNNILVADKFGSRVRIGAVTTDMPLEYDQPKNLAVRPFCEICKKCADNCPSRALSGEKPEDVRGVQKWPTEVDRCYAYWRAVGTDCGVCMAVCPFSHKNNWFHNAVRKTLPLNPWIRHVALWFDDRIYGRQWKPKDMAKKPL